MKNWPDRDLKNRKKDTNNKLKDCGKRNQKDKEMFDSMFELLSLPYFE